MAAEYPPTLTPEQHNFLLTSLTDWSLSHGLAVRPPPAFIKENPNNALATHAPVTCFPSVFPREAFVRAREIQMAYNELYAEIASERREEWLGEIIEEIASVDEFIAQLWKVYKEVKAEGFVQSLSLGLFRSDYMVHVDPNNANATPDVHQVEFNTIASSFGGLATRVSQMHRYLYRIGAYGDAPYINESSLPDNPAVTGLADGLAEGHKAYGEGVVSKEIAILFLVQNGERNIFDQRSLEYSILERYNIKSYRITFSEIPLLTTLHPTTRALLYHPPQRPCTSSPIEISTVYFRAGYDPSDYLSPQSWASRTHIERSRAIKCPTILTQLAGSKKIQQVLAAPSPPSSSSATFSTTSSILPTFLPHATPETIAKLESTFTKIYPLDTSPLGLKAREIALDPVLATGYVLKPQREGGGNNIYKSKISAFLNSIPEDHWSGYILMELIVTPEGVRNIVFRNGETMEGEVVGELGVYGVCLWDAAAGKDEVGWVKVNREAGWLLRTKGSGSEEGGVAAGFGCVDSVVLVD